MPAKKNVEEQFEEQTEQETLLVERPPLGITSITDRAKQLIHESVLKATKQIVKKLRKDSPVPSSLTCPKCGNNTWTKLFTVYEEAFFSTVTHKQTSRTTPKTVEIEGVAKCSECGFTVSTQEELKKAGSK